MARRNYLSESELQALLEVSDSDESVSEYENHTSEESETEQSDDDDTNSGKTVRAAQHIPSKDGKIQWIFAPFQQRGRLSAENVIRKTPGVTRYACTRIRDIKSAFETVFCTTIQNAIMKMTDIEGQRVYGQKWKNLNVDTFQAYIGLLLLAGVYRSYGEATKSLWDKETGRNVFRATMSLEQFSMISRVIRFDDKSTRVERRRADKLAPIRNIWEKWVEVLPKLYYPAENITIDEQLVAFRGRCPFKQYIPSKPAKYGIKIWTLCDSKSSYVLKLQIYTGKDPGQKVEKNQGMRVVCDLSSELRGHNLTCDNFFTSYNLGQLLLTKNITMLGTIRKNKPELPQQMSNKDVYSSSFYFTKDTTVVNYVPRKNKNVVLMSTLHRDKTISDREDKKPQIILDYNATKGAVDTLDQLVGTYTCKRKTNRWPMVVFYNMIDISAYNAFVLWTSINPDWNGNKLTKRRLFLEKLSMSLISEHVTSRKYMPRTEESRNIVVKMQEANQTIALGSIDATNKKRARCKFCPSSNDNKTNILCSNCKKHICKSHASYFCPDCTKS